jgi:hypothetical protein
VSEFSSPNAAGILPTHVASIGPQSTATQFARSIGVSQINASASYSNPTADTVLYFPIFLPWAYPVKRLFWVNGSTASSNVEVGVYSRGFTKIYSSGSVAQSGASVPQYHTPASSFWLAPGGYLLALTCSGTTNRLWGFTAMSATNLRSGGVFMSAHAPGAMPAIVTPVLNTKASFPLFGITNTASGW